MNRFDLFIQSTLPLDPDFILDQMERILISDRRTPIHPRIIAAHAILNPSDSDYDRLDAILFP